MQTRVTQVWEKDIFPPTWVQFSNLCLSVVYTVGESGAQLSWFIMATSDVDGEWMRAEVGWSAADDR